MEKVKNIFKIDPRYKTLIGLYDRVDGILMTVYFLFIIIAYYVMGIMYDKKGIYLGYQVSVMLIIIVISYILIRKQKIESIGFGKLNIKKSLILGVISASVVFMISFIPGVISGKELNSVSKLLSNFMYYLFVIALVEEIIFRGFIQTRIYGIIKKPFFAIIVVALMFMSMHIPFQMARADMDFFTFISNNFITLVFQFGWHIVFNFMYAKYNSIVAPTIFHTIMNWSNYLFIR